MSEVLNGAVEAVYEARHCAGIPADCCDYGVISHATGKEVCRVWDRDAAEQIAALLNAPVPATSEHEPWPDILTKAVGDITAALILAGKPGKIRAWTAPYIAAINRADSTPPEQPAIVAGLVEAVECLTKTYAGMQDGNGEPCPDVAFGLNTLAAAKGTPA